MVNEWLSLSCALGHAEGVSKEFFDDEEMWRGCECRVERQYRSGPLKAIAWEVKFGHGMYCTRPEGQLCFPDSWDSPYNFEDAS